jgi:putative thioredoxin
MTVPQFSRPGAIDLSALRPAAAAAGPVGDGAAAEPGSFTIDIVGEESLGADVLDRSMSVVVVVSFWSSQAPASMEINATLSTLADEFGGRFVFARVDVGAQPELAQALRIPQVPLVVAALRGQLAPLIQDPLPLAEMRSVLQQVLQAAAANGVTGVAAPVSAATQVPAEEAEAAEPEAKYPAAEDALMAGDYDTAIAEYEAALMALPNDEEATFGLAQAELYRRTSDVDAAAARTAAADNPADIDAQILVADLDLLGGHVDDAFARLVDLVRATSGDDRDRVRKHLVSMFTIVGDADPRVGKARSTLASALF